MEDRSGPAILNHRLVRESEIERLRQGIASIDDGVAALEFSLCQLTSSDSVAGRREFAAPFEDLRRAIARIRMGAAEARNVLRQYRERR